MKQKRTNFSAEGDVPTNCKINLVTFEKHIKELCPDKNFLEKEKIIDILAHVESIALNL
jgi:hypothetical protein